MLHCEARRRARRDQDGRYVPLSEQDVGLWSGERIEEAETLLWEASRLGRIGRFQLEAAIQSAHARRITGPDADWAAIVRLYEALVTLCPTLGARVAHAAAVAELSGAEAGLAILGALGDEEVAAYQPYWALRAHLARRLGRQPEGERAASRAAALTVDPAVREFLTRA